MSLIERLTRATVCLHLAPQALYGVLRRAGRPVPGSAFHLPILNPDASWEVALAALRGWLEQDGGKKLPLAVSLGLSSFFGFPVMVANEVVAVLEFFSQELQTPDDAMLRLMATTARA